MFTNKLRGIWASGRPVLNGWLSIGNPLTAEIMATQGYDAITIDLQHGALDFATALPMLQAMRAYDVTPMVRVPWREPGIIMKALDAGAKASLPNGQFRERGREFVKYMYYPPKGERSYGPTRAAFAYGGYDLKANDEVLAFAMIETPEGMDNLEAIAAVDGLAGIYIGPSDLTLGTQQGRLPPGFDRQEPEMIELIHRILEVCKRRGILACLHCGTAEYAARAVGWGFDLTTVSGDSRLLAAAAAASVGKWHELVSSEAPKGSEVA